MDSSGDDPQQHDPHADPHDLDPKAVRTRRWLYGAIALLAAVVVALGILLVIDSDDDEPVAGPSSTTSTEPVATTTSSTTSSTSTTVAPPVDTTTAVFPTAGSSARFTDPLEVARAFASDYVGFADPVVGTFREGDSRSGEVPIKPSATGPETTVFVRQLDSNWWVLGATTANIELTEPAALQTIGSPTTLRGRALAFEGTVVVELRADDRAEPIASTFVTGGGDQIRPFEGTLEFTPPAVDGGAIVLVTQSAENGQIWEASVVRTRFR